MQQFTGAAIKRNRDGTSPPQGVHPMLRTRLGDADKDQLALMLDVLDVFRTIRSTMPLQYVATFLLVAMDEGKSVIEYATKMGVSPSVMSRHLLDIGERNRRMQEGFGLVTYRANPMNLREHEYYLTPKGHAMAQSIVRKLQRRK
jgi:DNA-binding MarR family transcriptional regulator